MMLAPLVNAALEKGGTTAVMMVAPLVVSVWCWGFGLTLPIVGDKLPRTAGLDAYGGITLLGIYAAARLCRMYEIDKRMRTPWLLFMLPIFCLLTGIGFGDYNSPFAFALAGTCFLLVSRLKLNQKVGQFVTMLSPNMFAVYLIHNTEIGFSLMSKVEQRIIDIPFNAFVAFAVVAVFAFVSSVAIDTLRRVVIAMLRRSFCHISGGAE